MAPVKHNRNSIKHLVLPISQRSITTSHVYSVASFHLITICVCTRSVLLGRRSVHTLDRKLAVDLRSPSSYRL